MVFNSLARSDPEILGRNNGEGEEDKEIASARKEHQEEKNVNIFGEVSLVRLG